MGLGPTQLLGLRSDDFGTERVVQEDVETIEIGPIRLVTGIMLFRDVSTVAENVKRWSLDNLDRSLFVLQHLLLMLQVNLLIDICSLLETGSEGAMRYLTELVWMPSNHMDALGASLRQATKAVSVKAQSALKCLGVQSPYY